MLASSQVLSSTPPHGRGATVPKKQRPCPRSSGRSCGELREETPTTEDNETETVTLLIHAHTLNESHYRGKETWGIYGNPGPRELVIDHKSFAKKLANEESSQALPYIFL